MTLLHDYNVCLCSPRNFGGDEPIFDEYYVSSWRSFMLGDCIHFHSFGTFQCYLEVQDT